ncbi:hypothetical protein BJ508DRAFT_39430 [Ascobolus immersus RN42]|uniref:Uncharacterized protein n=1 Tax=Ascobolus immersus RN42 TaxID=1160509 RepID=A0A3N4HK77_ASCIM|nr:hypothetical protein BJ508DRAFT_39430 [Ascobolus immersus RN42]
MDDTSHGGSARSSQHHHSLPSRHRHRPSTFLLDEPTPATLTGSINHHPPGFSSAAAGTAPSSPGIPKSTAESRLLSLFAPHPSDPDPSIIASAALKLREARLGHTTAPPSRSLTTAKRPTSSSDRAKSPRSFLLQDGTRSLSAALGLSFLTEGDREEELPISEQTAQRVRRCREFFELESLYHDLSTIGTGEKRHNRLEAIRNRKGRWKDRAQLDLAPWRDLEGVKAWAEEVLGEGYDGRAGKLRLPPPPIPREEVEEEVRRRGKMEWIISPEELLADFYAVKTQAETVYKHEYTTTAPVAASTSTGRSTNLHEFKPLRHNPYETDRIIANHDIEEVGKNSSGFRHNPFGRHKDGYSSSDESGLTTDDESAKRHDALRRQKVKSPVRKRHHFRRRPVREDSAETDPAQAEVHTAPPLVGVITGEPVHREPDSDDSSGESDGFDTTVQIRRPALDEEAVVPSIAINLDPPVHRKTSPRKEKKERKEKPLLRLDVRMSMEDERGRSGVESEGEVGKLGVVKNRILRRKGSPKRGSQVELGVVSDVEALDKDKGEKEKEKEMGDKMDKMDKIKSPARKAKEKLDTRVSKIKAEVARVEGYIKGSSGTHVDSYPSSAISGSEDERGAGAEKWRENLSFNIITTRDSSSTSTKPTRPKLIQTQTAPSVPQLPRRPLPPIPTKDPLSIPGHPDIRPERPIMVFPTVQKHATRAAHLRRGLERAQSMEDISRHRRHRPEPLREVLEADKRLNEILRTPPKAHTLQQPPKGLWKSFQLEFSEHPAHHSQQLPHSSTFINSWDGRSPTPTSTTLPDLVSTPTSAVSVPSPLVPQGYFLTPAGGVTGPLHLAAEGGANGIATERNSYFSPPALSLATLPAIPPGTDLHKGVSPKEVLEMILPTTPLSPHAPPFPLLRQHSQPGGRVWEGPREVPRGGRGDTHVLSGRLPLPRPSPALQMPRSATLPRNTRFSTQGPQGPAPPLPSTGILSGVRPSRPTQGRTNSAQ